MNNKYVSSQSSFIHPTFNFTRFFFYCSDYLHSLFMNIFYFCYFFLLRISKQLHIDLYIKHHEFGGKKVNIIKKFSKPYLLWIFNYSSWDTKMLGETFSRDSIWSHTHKLTHVLVRVFKNRSNKFDEFS